MRTILIPSDLGDVVHNLAQAYAASGADVAVGVANFHLELHGAEVLHIMWPEELSGWKVPNEEALEAIESHLSRWAARSRTIATVHNLYPHGHHRNPAYRRLYSAVYGHAEVIHHTSRTSYELVCREYPEAAERNHLVRLGYNYDRLLGLSARDRGGSRRKLGLDEHEIAFLVVGTLRSWEEARLLMDGFARARVPAKRLVICARLNDQGSRVARAAHRLRWQSWQRRLGVKAIEGYISDAQLGALLDAADAVVVVRPASMGSGVPCLAMTFGRLVVCPNTGAMPEYVSGSGNVLYRADSPESLAEALERAAAANRDEIGAANRRIAAEWSWDGIVKACLAALPPR